jgi:hypothetical protein
MECIESCSRPEPTVHAPVTVAISIEAFCFEINQIEDWTMVQHECLIELSSMRQGGRYGEVYPSGNLTLYKKRLSETRSEAEREMLLKLLAEERNKEVHPKQGSS